MKKRNILIICVVLLIAVIAIVCKLAGGNQGNEPPTETVTNNEGGPEQPVESVTETVSGSESTTNRDETISEVQEAINQLFSNERELEYPDVIRSTSVESEPEENAEHTADDLQISFSEDLNEEISWIFLDGFHETFMNLLYEYLLEMGATGEINLSVSEYSLDNLYPVYHFILSGWKEPIYLDFDMSVNAFVFLN